MHHHSAEQQRKSFIYLEPLHKPTRGEVYYSRFKHRICWWPEVFGSPYFFLHTILLTVNQTGFKSIYSFVVVLLLKYVKNIFQAKAH